LKTQWTILPSGIEVILTRIGWPQQNGYTERFVKSIKTECLDHFIIQPKGTLFPFPSDASAGRFSCLDWRKSIVGWREIAVVLFVRMVDTSRDESRYE